MRRRVHISRIVINQQRVYSEILLEYAAGKDRGSDPVRAVQLDDGRYLLRNGVHRFLVAAIRGDHYLELEIVPG